MKTWQRLIVSLAIVLVGAIVTSIIDLTIGVKIEGSSIALGVHSATIFIAGALVGMVIFK